MRLGQLARKLEIRPAEIVEFLSRNNITIEDGSNTRVEDDHTTLVIRHFNPALLIEAEGAPEAAKQEEVIEPIQPEPIQEILIEGRTEENPVSESVPAMEDETSVEPIEVIKAPKAELPGLKVLGKIELPESKKKDVINPSDTDQGEVQSETRPARQERRPVRNNNRREENWKNPIALQREREAKEAEEKRKAQLELEKEKRMVHYLKKVKKTDQPVKSRKSDYEDQEEVSTQKAEVPPKTWLGKFLKWLSTP
ncbi:MAG TPA: hypothetical protein VIT44_18095 [Cyclobacteriaceae bacterium]